MFDDDDMPDDEGLGFLETYELPEPEGGGWANWPMLDEEWDG